MTHFTFNIDPIFARITHFIIFKKQKTEREERNYYYKKKFIENEREKNETLSQCVPFLSILSLSFIHSLPVFYSNFTFKIHEKVLCNRDFILKLREVKNVCLFVQANRPLDLYRYTHPTA